MTSTTTIRERYQSAQNSSDLKVVAEIRGDADYIIAAGMSKAELGGKLRSLQAEWDGVSQPPRYKKADVERVALELPQITLGNGRRSADFKQARKMLEAHRNQELKLVGLRLHSFFHVRDAMRRRAENWGNDYAKASHIAHDVLMWWLAPTCQHCGGTKFELMKGTNRLSDRACKHCHGTGHDRCPHGQDGRRMAAWIEGALDSGLARQRALLMNVGGGK